MKIDWGRLFTAQNKRTKKIVTGLPVYYWDQWWILRVKDAQHIHLRKTNDPDYTDGLKPDMPFDAISHFMEPIEIDTLGIELKIDIAKSLKFKEEI